MINLSGEPATLAQRSFGVVEPGDVKQVDALLEAIYRGALSDEELHAHTEALTEIAVAAGAEAALIRGELKSREFDLLGRPLSRRGIRAVSVFSKVWSLYPLSDR